MRRVQFSCDLLIFSA